MCISFEGVSRCVSQQSHGQAEENHKTTNSRQPVTRLGLKSGTLQRCSCKCRGVHVYITQNVKGAVLYDHCNE
jgi:hypothetical protein